MNFRLRLFVADEYKPLKTVSFSIWLLVVLAFLAQIGFYFFLLPEPKIQSQKFDSPPSTLSANFVAFGEPETLAKMTSLYVQAFDNQPGVSIPFHELNYESLGEWLDLIVLLDKKADYPHFLMSKVYTSVKEESRRRFSIQWVRRQFLDDPTKRWEWMVHATNSAQYILKDKELALKMATELRIHTKPGEVPSWIRQLEVFFLRAADEFEAAATLLANQLEAGEILDPHEFAFSIEQLNQMVKTMIAEGRILEKSNLAKKAKRIQILEKQFLDQFEYIPSSDSSKQ